MSPATLLLALSLCAGPGDDFAARYTPTIDRTPDTPALPWTMDAGDVWRVSGLRLDAGERLAIELEACDVAIGRHGTNAMFAVVFPDLPSPLRSSLAGDADPVCEVWLRFNPNELDQLFPRASIAGPGAAGTLLWARRTAAWKMRASWQAGNLPVVVERGFVTADLDTATGARRFYVVNRARDAVRYEPAFEKRPVPARLPASREDSLRVFDAVWDRFDRTYAMFPIRRGVDWDAQKTAWREKAGECATTYELASALAGMLSALDDLHVWVRLGGDESLPVCERDRPLNADWDAAGAMIGPLTDHRHGLAWGRTSDGVGYLNISSLGDARIVRDFDEAMEMLKETRSILLDLRFNGGGDELTARRLAGRFLDRAVVYSTNRYRSGPGREDLGPVLERACEPRGPWRYEGKLVVLTGQRTMSSAESFALMLRQAPGALLMGDRTAGSSGKPEAFSPGLGIEVGVPQWLDMDKQGNPIERRGVAPDVRIEAAPERFTPTDDPVLGAALAEARKE